MTLLNKHGKSKRLQHSRQRRSALMIESLENRCLLSVSIINGREMETLNRGIVAINQGSSQVYVGWRLLATDPDDVTFNLYRSTGGGAATKLNPTPISATTDFVNTGVNLTQSNAYFVKPVIDGVEQVQSETFTLPANSVVQQHLDIALTAPPITSLPDGSTYTYNANDSSVGDLDGDGQYEIIVKWDPSDSKDSSQDGFTGPTYFDAYNLNGTRLWRINLGQNIRAGAHYTQFTVYDLDGDGKSEIAMKTAPGTIDGLGNAVLLGSDHVTDDYRNATTGRVNTGPEYLTIFNGQTGAAMATVPFTPDRINTSSWGDDYGNRQDRILMAVAYLDGQKPSLVLGRGIFGPQAAGHAVRNEVTAYNWRNNQLTQQWWFRADQNTSAYGLPNVNTSYIGQGTYDMQPSDIDGDGKDEIVYGAMVIDDNGAPKFNTGLGHGDALHVGDLDPTRPGIEIFETHELPDASHPGTALVDPSGAVVWSTQFGVDVARGVCADIDPSHPGEEAWTAGGGSLYDMHTGAVISAAHPSQINFAVWWDADLSREIEDGTSIFKWNPSTSTTSTILAPTGLASNNGSKSTPCLAGDILGDWREEVIWRKADNTGLQIWTTTNPAANRFDTLAQNCEYREGLAWQNVGYNQPPHPSVFLGNGMTQRPPAPTNLTATAISSSQINLAWTASAGATSYTIKRATSATGPFTIIATGVTGTTYPSTGLSASTTYFYFIDAVNSAGGSLNSNQASATTTGSNQAPTVATPAAASPSPVTGTTTNLSVLGADDGGEAALTYTWAATGPASVSYSANGTNAAKNSTATFTAAGNYSFTVTIRDAGGLTTTSNVNVTVNQTLTSIVVSPSSVSVPINGTQQFTATARDQFAANMSSQPSFTWSVFSGGGTVNASGLYTAPGTAGSATVRATSGSVNGNASVTITATGDIFTNDADIGSPSPAGSASFASGTYTVRGGGADIWGTSDQFHYHYKSVTGDVTITARVASVQNTNSWAKAGVMIRATTAANSAHAMVVATPSTNSGVAFQRRATTGGSSTNDNVTGIAAPYWVRLVRSGNNFTAFRSVDGNIWTQVGATQTITMSSTVLVGLVVCSHANGTLCTATLDNVSGTVAGGGPLFAAGGSQSAQASATPAADSSKTKSSQVIDLVTI